MNLKELIAGMLSLLVTAGTLVAVSAATTLDQYPGFLVSAGQLNAYVVVGSGGTDPAGLASDIAGAVDIAVRLAELQYSKTTVSAVTTAAVDGVERQIPVAGADYQRINRCNRWFAFTITNLPLWRFETRNYKLQRNIL
jgi:S-layer protein (TIGR01564 family)